MHDEKARRRADRELVAGYHEARLGELVGRVAAAVDGWRAGDLDVFDVDETIHRYHRASQRLWGFCNGGAAAVGSAADGIRRLDAEGEVIDWWARGAPRRSG